MSKNRFPNDIQANYVKHDRKICPFCKQIDGNRWERDVICKTKSIPSIKSYYRCIMCTREYYELYKLTDIVSDTGVIMSRKSRRTKGNLE